MFLCKLFSNINVFSQRSGIIPQLLSNSKQAGERHRKFVRQQCWNVLNRSKN